MVTGRAPRGRGWRRLAVCPLAVHTARLCVASPRPLPGAVRGTVPFTVGGQGEGPAREAVTRTRRTGVRAQRLRTRGSGTRGPGRVLRAW